MWTQKDWKKIADKQDVLGFRPNNPDSGQRCTQCGYKGHFTEWYGEVDDEPEDICPKCKTLEEPEPSWKCSCGEWAEFQGAKGNEEMFAWVYKCKCGEYWSD